VSRARLAWRSLAALVVLGVVAAGCATGGTPARSTSTEVVRVGSAVALTGSLASGGELTKDGYEICQEVVNADGGVDVGGRHLPLQITYADDQSSPSLSAQLVDQMNDQGIKLILGPYGSSATQAVAPVAERNHQLLVDTAGADSRIFDHGYRWVFGVDAPIADYEGSLVRAVVDLARPTPRTAVFLTANDGFSLEATKYGVETARRLGLAVLAVEQYPAGSTDVSSVLTRIAPLHPEVIFQAGHFVEGVAVVEQAYELHILPEDGFAELVAPTESAFVRVLGPLADGVLASTEWVRDQPSSGPYFGSAEQYYRRYEQLMGARPDYHAAEASAGCIALVLAIEKAGSLSPAAVRRAMAGLDVDTFFGRIHFAPNGQNVGKGIAVVQLQRGQPVPVWPKDLAEAPLCWPAVSPAAARPTPSCVLGKARP